MDTALAVARWLWEHKFRVAQNAIVAHYILGIARNVYKTGLKRYFERLAISLVKAVPGGAKLLAAETQRAVDDIKAFTAKESSLEGLDIIGEQRAIPSHGWNRAQLIDAMKHLRGAEKEYRAGHAHGGIYYDGKDIKDGANEAYCAFVDSNALYPTVFPALRKFEVECVRMCATLMHGDDRVCGALTSGGTESILMAVRAARERGRSRGITEPEAVVPISAHPAFAKACDFLCVKLVLVDTLPSGHVDVRQVRQRTTSNTVLIVGSAPQFAQGTIDDIASLAVFAHSRDIGMHVDCCLGGFLLPWLVQLGHVDARFDFAVPGVTSVSVDIHKYGFGAKGASAILFRNAEWRRFMFTAYTEWNGGMYCSPTMTGSRSGGVIASTYATLLLMGQDGYLRVAQDCWNTFSRVRDGVRAIPGLELAGQPDAACVAFRCTSGPPQKAYQVAAALKELSGWNLNYCQKPICVQVQLGSKVAFEADRFCADLEAAVRAVDAEPERFSKGLAQIYGMAASLGDREVVGDILKAYLDAIYSDTK